MPPKMKPADSAGFPENKKRKEHPQSSSSSQKGPDKGRGFKRVKMINDARSIMTQASDTALKNGDLDVQSFLKAREFEIKALQDGIKKSKGGRTTRAFQQVPRDMRRRTASHNVKRVPKRLQKRAGREMRDDNTPTVDPSKRKPRSTRGRLRAETAKRLGLLAAKKRAVKAKIGDRAAGIETRAARPKIRKDKLNEAPKQKSKFGKRQIHKTWLPTHMWHAKRARMTEPKNPLWRFSIPLTSTEKSYRPTHQAAGARGAVAWDMSYISTIGAEGTATSLEKLLKAMGVTDNWLWDEKGMKWRHGKRTWSGWLSRTVNDKSRFIGPSTIFWCPTNQQTGDEPPNETKRPSSFRIFIRIHPSAFLETWTEILRLSKLQRPAVHIEDLRFEIGSIDITGPGSTEALLGILHPYNQSEDNIGEHAKTFLSLAGVTNPGSLPLNSLLAFSIIDPRLRYPPRPSKVPGRNDEEANSALLEMLSAWPADASTGSPALFDRDARHKGTRLPAQKSLNRRKALAPPGDYPSVQATDPPIPIMLLTSRPAATSAQGTWTLLAPWKCILPIWYGLVHYPLSSGGNPRFGGMQELRQIHFEQGVPWFPVDFPGTKSGFTWETEERVKRKKEWEKRPKGKRVEWDSLDLGRGRKGETGLGWACDFERVLAFTPLADSGNFEDASSDVQNSSEKSRTEPESPIEHVPKCDFLSLLSSKEGPQTQAFQVATIRITLMSRGIASPCARIYRLPQPTLPQDSSVTSGSLTATTREQWLSLLPTTLNSKPLPGPNSKTAKNTGRIALNTPLPQRVRLLAQSLLQQPPLPFPANKKEEDGYPLVPDEDDLIGFVTTGEFNLAEGKGVAIGTVFVGKLLDGFKSVGKKGGKDGKLCIVRNPGEKVGRLARWEPV
ncbi:ribonuclease-like protein P complex subunit Pop1 [Stipitochalara longipes BDJ]|nr:ribonuclease-like protein P complex subunit Pop1 [Stipitochalara longipes BDJ]